MHKRLFVFLAIVFIFVSASCTNSKSEYGKEQFYAELQGLGYDVSSKEEMDGTLFSKKGERIANVGNEGIVVFEFSSAKDANNNAKYIDRDGSGTSGKSPSVAVSWVASPHFYKKGKTVVQYIGDDTKIIRDLQSLLGQQFAGTDRPYTDYMYDTPPKEEMLSEIGAVIDVHGKVKNIKALDRFVDNFNASKTDKVTVVSYTIEGDPIIFQLIYDGEKITYYSDTRQDKFGQQSVIKQELMSIRKSGNEYILSGETIGTENKEFVFLQSVR